MKNEIKKTNIEIFIIGLRLVLSLFCLEFLHELLVNIVTINLNESHTNFGNVIKSL